MARRKWKASRPVYGDVAASKPAMTAKQKHLLLQEWLEQVPPATRATVLEAMDVLQGRISSLPGYSYGLGEMGTLELVYAIGSLMAKGGCKGVS